MVIGFCRGLKVEELFLNSLDGMLKFWMRFHWIDRSPISWLLWGGGLRVTVDNVHMIPLVDLVDSGFEVRKWMGRKLDILVGKM